MTVKLSGFEQNMLVNHNGHKYRYIVKKNAKLQILSGKVGGIVGSRSPFQPFSTRLQISLKTISQNFH
jgi:hypothetical protein